MSLIGNNIEITTHTPTAILITENQFIGLGMQMTFGYDTSVSPNEAARLVHRGLAKLRHTFQIEIMMDLADAENLHFEFLDYIQKQRAGIGAPYWALENNRLKTIEPANSVLTFRTFECYPVDINYIPESNEWATVMITLAEV